ncbi:MAG: tetratricopeptide repeat protein [Spirochaetaceae bacterium]|jgi:tetratricopeptide (TPR) repeat protein|nr:tetratricopeptide repeat protein [Spirochaetaceae bacterium]
MKKKMKAKIAVLAALAIIAVLLAGCAKKEAPIIPAESAPVENAASIIPVPDESETATPVPATPVQQAPADKPETVPATTAVPADKTEPASAMAAAPVQQVPADKTEPASAMAATPAQQVPAKQPEAAVSIDTPSVPQPADVRAEQYLVRKEFDEAIAAYTEIIRLNPGDADAYYGRGDAYYGKGDIDRASADWNEAIRLNPAFAARLAQNPAGGADEAAARARESAERMNRTLQTSPGYTGAMDALSRQGEAFDF